jgi:hypothetical protein
VSDQPLSDEPRHPIPVVVRCTGVSQDMLRVWENRHAAVMPGRTPGGQRLDSDADIHRLRLIREALESGRRIGQVAGLPTEALAALLAALAGAAEGWRVTYLGPDLPADDSAAAARRAGARAVALGIVFPPDDPELPGRLRRSG